MTAGQDTQGLTPPLGGHWKRPLIPVVLALMAGLAAGAWGLEIPGKWLVAGLALLWGLLGLCYWYRPPFPLLLLIPPLLFFAGLGTGLYHQALKPHFHPDHVARLPVGEELVFTGRLARPSRVTPEGLRLFLAGEAWKGPRNWEPVRGMVLVQAPPFTPPPVGSRVVVRGKLREFRDLKNPGAPSRTRQWAADGIFRQLPLKEPGHLVVLAANGEGSLAERLRGGIRGLLQDLAPHTQAIYLAMLLGDQGQVTQEMRENLARTGTSHLLVISGLHLSAVAAVTFFGVFWLLRRFSWLLLRVNALKLATLAAVLPVLAYAHLAGGSPATQRAEIMVLAYLLLVYLGRPREIWSALALAALIILVLSPLRLFSVSFQLSFAAVAGIWYLVPRWWPEGPLASSEKPAIWKARLWRWAWEALAVSGAASLATAPLVAHHFQVVSVYGFLVNLAAIPLMLMVALPLGELAVLSEALGLTFLARLLLRLGEVPIKLAYALISWVARLPGSALTVPTPTWLQVTLLYLLVFFLFPWRRRFWTWAGAVLTGAVLAATVVVPLITPQPACEITILDSRTGLDGVVVAPGGRRLAVSAAWPVYPGEAPAGPGALPGYLHWRQFRRLEGIVALQLNPRNAQELLTLVKQFEVGGLWWRGARPAGAMVTLMNLLGDTGRPARDLARGNPPRFLGEVQLDYWEGSPGQEMALKVTCQGRQVLLLPPLGRDSSGLKWPPESDLEALVAPEDAAPELVARFSARNLIFYGSREPGKLRPGWRVPVFYTREGAVTLHLDGGGASVRQWRP